MLPGSMLIVLFLVKMLKTSIQSVGVHEKGPPAISDLHPEDLLLPAFLSVHADF